MAGKALGGLVTWIGTTYSLKQHLGNVVQPAQLLKENC